MIAAQLPLFTPPPPQAPPRLPASRVNSSGVFIDCLSARLEAAERGPRLGGGKPVILEILIAYDGRRYHWALSINIPPLCLGYGFAPAEKWQKHSVTLQLAAQDAAHEAWGRIQGKPIPRPLAKEIDAWLEGIERGSVEFVECTL